MNIIVWGSTEPQAIYFLKYSYIIYYMAKSKDYIIKMKCQESGHVHYWTKKNKKQNPNPLELRKFNPVLKKHTLYKESKK